MLTVNHAAGRMAPKDDRKRWPPPTVWALVGLGVLVVASGFTIYHFTVDDNDHTDQSEQLAQGDFWQRPGARSLGSQPTMGTIKTPATGTLAVVEAASQALVRPKGITINANGGIRLSRALRNTLDDHLGAADGPVGPEALERARQKLRKELSGPVATEALDVLERYGAYRNAAAALEERTALTPALPANFGVMPEVVALQRRGALRTQMLNADMRDAFFADEEALEQYRLTLLQLQSMASFSDAERDAQLKPLWQQLPAHLRTQIPAPGTTAVGKTQ